MDEQKSQLLDRIKQANNILVTVSKNPSVDQLSAAIGLTLMLNKMGKHATAVFSGAVPSTIEFLKPEETLEKNTDSLRDFIIALDKSKADKLRYKVEDSHVKIFITPYRTSISDADLNFSQGDFNVEVVVALGVTEQTDLDQAITAHGRILHDATTATVLTGGQSNLGSINWSEPAASSLCEMVASIAGQLQADVLDAQMATALMTGVVAETDRFSNEKTAPSTMTVSAALMAAGANQQLVASELQQKPEQTVIDESSATPEPEKPAASNDGSLQIEHAEEETPQPDSIVDQIQIDDAGNASLQEDSASNEEVSNTTSIRGGSSLILEPPTLGAKMTANDEPEHLDPAVDPLGLRNSEQPLLSHDSGTAKSSNDEPLQTQDPTSDMSVSIPDAPQEATDAPDLPLPSMDLPSEDAIPTVLPEPQAPQAVEPEQTIEPNDRPFSLADLEASVGAVHATDQMDTSSPVVDEAPSTIPVPDMDPSSETLGLPQDAPTPDAAVDQPASLDSARDAVTAAIAGSDQPLPPIAALGSQPLDLDIQATGETGKLDHIDEQTGEMQFTMPENLVPPNDGLPTDPTAAVSDPTQAPDLPPPLTPDVYGAFTGNNPNQQNTQDPGPQPGNPFNLPPA